MPPRTHLELRFSLPPEVELVETAFTHPSFERALVTRRGKGAFDGTVGSFQWTSAVQALSELVLRTVDAAANPSSEQPMLSGGRGSLASSLDLALTKEPNWLAEMFGVDSLGTLFAKRLFSRSNSNLKRPGPVEVRLNKAFLSVQQIALRGITGDLICANELLKHLRPVASLQSNQARTEVAAKEGTREATRLGDLRALYAYASVAPFVGREEELRILKAAIAEPERAPIAVLGPPGIGKTHLVIRALTLADDSEAHSRYVVPISCEGLNSIEDIEERVALQLGHTRKVASAALADILKSSRATLVFDDAEALLRKDEKKFVHALQHFALIPDVRLVAIFRGSEYPRYALKWQRPVTVKPLTREQTAELVRQLLPSDPELDVLGELIEVTGGVPIAVQALCKRASCYGDLRELLRHFSDESLPVLDEEAGLDGLSRSAARSFTLAVGDPLVNAEARQILRVVAQFPAGVTRERLTAAFPTIAASAIASLVRVGLLSESVPSGRVFCLPPIRRFIAAKLTLASARAIEFEEALFRYTRQHAAHVGYQADGQECARLILTELAEITAAIEAGLKSGRTQPATHAAAAFANVVDFTGFGDIKVLCSAADAAGRAGLKDIEAELHERLGDIALVRGDPAGAREHFQRALTHFSASTHRSRHAKCSKRLADIAVERGDSRLAELLYTEAEVQYQSLEDESGLSRCLRGRATLAIREGKYKKGETLCREALAKFQATHDLLGQANAEKTMGLVCLLSAKDEMASRSLEAARNKFEKLGDTLGIGEASRYLAALATKQGAFEVASALLEVAASCFRALSRQMEAHETVLALLRIRVLTKAGPPEAKALNDITRFFSQGSDPASAGYETLAKAVTEGGEQWKRAASEVSEAWRRVGRHELLLSLVEPGINGEI